MALNLPGDPAPRTLPPARVTGIGAGSTGFSALLRPLLPDGPWEHRLLHARRTRFHVALAGHRNPGPLLLLLPDVGRSWWSWRLVLPRLAAAGHRVAALDPRGIGATDKTPHGYRLAETAEDVLAVARAFDQPTVLVGHGWGGVVAQAVAVRAPELVAALVLVAAPEARTLQGYRKLLRAARLGATGLPPSRLARWADWPRLPEDAPCRIALSAWPGPQRAVAPLGRAAARPGGLSAVGTPHVPTLRVGADADSLLPRPFRSIVVLDGGHWLPEDAPEALVDTVSSWLTTLDRRRPAP